MISDCILMPGSAYCASNNRSRLIRAAVVYADRCYLSWRHSEAILYIRDKFGVYTPQDSQGFVDEKLYFWGREDSAEIALQFGQIVEQCSILTSEYLWDKYGRPRKPGVPWHPMS
jgi:hypothetical protein